MIGVNAPVALLFMCDLGKIQMFDDDKYIFTTPVFVY
jgi:hypothetical protein